MPRHRAHARIVLHHLSYAHPDGTPQFTALSLGFELRRYGLVGANGSGKTTLLRLIIRELEPQDGAVSTPDRIAYIPQILARDDRSSATLSGGEQTCAALEAALARKPLWLLLDEPTNHLDAVNRERVYELVQFPIAFSNVNKSCESPPVFVVRDFSMSIKQGEFCCLIGPSGFGKSTVLN